MLLVQLVERDGGAGDAGVDLGLHFVEDLLVELGVLRVEALVVVGSGCDGAVEEVEFDAGGGLVDVGVVLYCAETGLELGETGGALVEVLREAPGGAGVEGGDASGERGGVLGVRVGVVHVLLGELEIVGTGSFCRANAVDSERGFERDALLWDVELGEEVECGDGMGGDGMRPERS